MGKEEAHTSALNDNSSSTNGDMLPPSMKKRTTTATNYSDDTDFDDYFVGPRDLDHHSKWPIFLRLHGSVTPGMVLPLLFVGGWSSAITAISAAYYNLGINSVLLTVLGFVVGLALSFRSSTAYERYNEGRKYWSQLAFCSQNLARLIWVHAEERHNNADDPLLGKKDLLAKVSCLNMIVAFANALKHKLRFEPYAHYDDLQNSVSHLDTFAKRAGTPENSKPPNAFKRLGRFLGIPMAESNPRKQLKKAKVPVGNLPLEILSHLSSYMKTIYENETLKTPIYQTQSLTALTTFNDILTGTDRILQTPLPLAYSIAIGQITWVYILLLPFQLYKSLGWVTIPASIFAAYVILGIALIGREIENPFGDDVNDLPLDSFCSQIQADIDIIMATPPPLASSFLESDDNQPLFPLSQLSTNAWLSKSVEEIRGALGHRASVNQRHSSGGGVDADEAAAAARKSRDGMTLRASASVRRARRDVEQGGAGGGGVVGGGGAGAGAGAGGGQE